MAGFGFVSALSNPGSQTTTAGTQVATDAGTSGSTTGTSAANTTTGVAGTLQPAVQAPTRVFGGGRTTTGGS